MMHNYRSIPKKQGLYDPAHEHDACGVGFVVNIKGDRSHDIVAKGLQVLNNLTHRGACGCDPRTGDGAGILVQIPHDFFASEAARLGFKLPAPGEYGVGQVFLPLDAVKRKECEEAFERIVVEEGQRILGWRDVPVVESACGDIARRGMPAIRQVFIARSADVADAEALERKLYVIRKRAITEAEKLGLFDPELFYFCSLSAADRRLQGPADLDADSRVFSRFARRRFQERAGDGASALLDQHVPELGPGASVPLHVAQRRDQHAARQYQLDACAREAVHFAAVRRRHQEDCCRSSSRTAATRRLFDNCLELLMRTGRSLPHAVMMMIPEAWQNDRADERQQARVLRVPFLHDGAVGRAGVDRVHRRDRRSARCSIATACGRRVTTVTKDGLVVMASEAGVLDIAPENVAHKGRLQPGRMFLVDTDAGPNRAGRGDQRVSGVAAAVSRSGSSRQPGRSSSRCPRRPARRRLKASSPTIC